MIKSNHLLIDAFKVDGIRDIKKIQTCLENIVKEISLNVLNKQEHFFPNDGYTAVYLLSESHMSIHTWTDEKYFSFDLFHCSDFDYMKVVDYIKQEFNCEVEFQFVNRLKRDIRC